MSFIDKINSTLRPSSSTSWTALDLFAGCGGLSLGFESAGFQTVGYEIEKYAAETYSTNLRGNCFTEKLTKDTKFSEKFDIVIGGPPCQPFSVGGNQRGIEDDRDGFPAFIHAIRMLMPKAWLFENVRGMLYSNKWYFDEVIEELQSIGYTVDFKLLNAVHFGVPQNRERLFVVGHFGGYNFPKPSGITVTVKDAISDLIDSIEDESKILNASMDRYIANYEKASKCINPRDLHLSKPARTLTCRNLAGATGDMQRVKLKDGRRRRLSVQEAARLQSFPDWFSFSGTETSQFYQIGNAVPPLLGYQLALSLNEYLVKFDPKQIVAPRRPRKKPEQLSIF
ncbi:DNA (cytosine-5)-methyltransferase 1 [Dyadobacter sp. BE34]|uniref:Cytosine-specific methyltransferase n=1 Tax=Dyadobacter fermentans TaxID=94254 RepID=A0ABU1R2A0_9BACT|nr:MULTISPECIES: DNA cytosine methyltransferase [Dyadobacter]MDR6807523.1 DNA (cytosine-5)-methyltransferase 1 [Dyadobacter fermentans]MDR7045264.1 DNA (cytosine-5)-methyltransferase 1 [Dyadobacter sp. BE242]MDR7199577.1 DNA (cytosine-5)-methyltransferase 1 [Dyadobacter sp. BE34]MDR7217964.1 DNA (cytosine-5)-methyltransferase 1 [Dyadobacter sp. BE31]MDR7265468.1 DNA (cytosine-5)-methyltransferase 1 [Dyadobacter sp. BE32]